MGDIPTPCTAVANSAFSYTTLSSCPLNAKKGSVCAHIYIRCNKCMGHPVKRLIIFFSLERAICTCSKPQTPYVRRVGLCLAGSAPMRFLRPRRHRMTFKWENVGCAYVIISPSFWQSLTFFFQLTSQHVQCTFRNFSRRPCHQALFKNNECWLVWKQKKTRLSES